MKKKTFRILFIIFLIAVSLFPIQIKRYNNASAVCSLVCGVITFDHCERDERGFSAWSEDRFFLFPLFRGGCEKLIDVFWENYERNDLST